MSENSITIALDEHTLEALRLLADVDDLSAEECARRILSSAAIEEAVKFRAFVQEGLDAVDRGEVHTTEEVFEHLRTRRKLLDAA